MLNKWLEAWGYSDSRGSLHLSSESLPADHPYRSELVDLLNPQGHIRAQAVFDVEGVPTVCFLEQGGDEITDSRVFDLVRQRAWNQNLVSIVLFVDDQRATAVPTSIRRVAPETIEFTQARSFGNFSREDIQSGAVFTRHPSWFSPENRVDRKLLKNLAIVVKDLQSANIGKTDAQLLIAQVLFVAYLEHRGIVGDAYRASRGVGSLFELVSRGDSTGIVRLMEKLKDDFNGDLLGPKSYVGSTWGALSSKYLQLISSFLSKVDLEAGQLDLWSYDFRYIPVELISGIYESFLSDDKKDSGAYYTPRHLATLVVDQAFAQTQNILEERVYDGACGSGILLTTAYRRMLAQAEAEAKRQWDFSERIELLKRNIFGSDINTSACRVTAFSLYLSVLEHLEPSDITKLTDRGASKLPDLVGTNICAGATEGDFFSDSNKHFLEKKFTIFLSNPPWVEPKKKNVLSADVWAKEKKAVVPRRQLSAAFMLRALDCMDPNGRLCFILPFSVLGASTSQQFVRKWLQKCELDVVINFGDIRKLLFEEAKSPTLVVVARPRSRRPDSFLPETFEYWVPKADISFAFGRLALHATDRHQVPTSKLAYDNTVLTTLYWGGNQDQSTISRIGLSGQVGDMFALPGWWSGKGFHKLDSSISDPVSSKGIARIKHLDARRFSLKGAQLDLNSLVPFPRELTHVARLSKDLLAAFDGPRIVIKDGMTPDRGICAGFSSQPFSFSSSIGVIKAPKEDADLLRFLSVYLHSDLARYFFLLTAYQVSFERERITITDIKKLPFVAPASHRNSERAKEIVSEIASFVRESSEEFELFELVSNLEWKDRAEVLIAEYFGLTELEVNRISEIVTCVLPSVQPSSIEALQTPLQQKPTDRDLKRYSETLLTELGAWRDAMGGEGSFAANISLGSAQTRGAVGMLRLDIKNERLSDGEAGMLESADDAVAAVIDEMRRKNLLPVQVLENMYLAADIVIHYQRSIYLVKPLVRRLWLQGEAIRDAERVVRSVQGVVEE